MSDILPLLLLPAVVGWWLSEWKQRRTRAGLRDAIARARRPLLADAGSVSVVTVARSLETEPAAPCRDCPWWIVGRARTAWEVRLLAAPLGLALDEVIRPQRDHFGRTIGFVGASRFTGIRHGRAVAVALGATSSTITLDLPEVQLPEATVWADEQGALVANGNVPPALEAALHTLAPSRRWRGLTIACRDAGITLERPAASAGSWLHDLWLAEFVADLVAPAPVAQPARDLAADPRVDASPALAFGT